MNFIKINWDKIIFAIYSFIFPAVSFAGDTTGTPSSSGSSTGMINNPTLRSEPEE